MKKQLPHLRFYGLVLILIAAGWVWLLLSQHLSAMQESNGTVCLIKKVSGIPCPSCGSTRSVQHLFAGHIPEAIATNPLGLILAALLMVLPVWIGRDILAKSDSFYRAYKKTEQAIRQRKIAIPLILLVTANWIWNIFKGL